MPGYKLLILTFVLIFFHTAAWPQLQVVEKDLSAGKMKARAENALNAGDIYTALFYLEEAVKNAPEDLAARFRLAEVYRLSRNYKKASEAYQYVYEKAPTSYPFALYYQGIMQKMTGEFEEAKETLKKFKKEAGRLGDKDFKKILSREIAGCDSAISYREFPENVNIQNAGKSVNHPHTEFSPTFLDSVTILFGSLRLDSLAFFEIKRGKEETRPYRQIYKAHKVNGQWVEKGKDEVINDAGMEMGNLAYSPYSDKYYFSKCERDKNGKVLCRIYFTEKVKGRWSQPELLPEPVNIEGFTSTQPTIMTDSSGLKEYLYFVSDRPGGKGGLDIWYTSFNTRKKVWTDPRNGGLINTSETECTPFFHIPTQTLYFSSNGHVNAGGLDVFKTWKDDQGRTVYPQNLSFPLNSPQDDLDFHLSPDGKSGFFVSNRPGGTPYFHETCCDDIFAFEILPPKPFECTLQLAVETGDTSCAGKTLEMVVVNLKTKEEKQEKITLVDCNYSLALDAHHEYIFTIKKDGYESDSLIVVTKDMAATVELNKKLVLKPVVKEQKEIIAEKPVEGEAFVLRDIQYATDEDELNEEGRAVLDSLLIPFLKEHPADKIMISSHTDDQGSKKYNHDLSQRRAYKVQKYLISKGIDASRITARGFGESKPIAPNLNLDGTPNEIGRSMNRRTEFFIPKP